jgi:hypothetical protein
MRADILQGQVGGGWALEIEIFLEPVKWHRAVRRVPYGAQKVGNKETELLHSEVKRRVLPFLNCLKCQFAGRFCHLPKDMQRGGLYLYRI